MERIRNKGGNLPGILLLVLLFTGIWFAAGSVTADGASASYQKLEANDGASPYKVGTYYFKYTYNDESYIGTWAFSKKKNSGFKTIYKSDRMGNIVTNGKTVYYIDYNKLYRYTISKKKTKLLKKLPVKEEVGYHISAAYGKNVYLTRSSFYEWRMDTYMYNTSSKKYKKVKSNYGIKDQYGKYVVGQEEYRTDVSAYPIRVCKLNSSGMTKGKRLTKAGFSETYIKNKLYYVKYSDQGMKKAVLYRATANASKKTVLGKFSTTEEYGQVIITNITSKNCLVYTDGHQYKYTYKTKKMTLIE